jgi:hypothetical protein
MGVSGSSSEDMSGLTLVQKLEMFVANVEAQGQAAAAAAAAAGDPPDPTADRQGDGQGSNQPALNASDDASSSSNSSQGGQHNQTLSAAEMPIDDSDEEEEEEEEEGEEVAIPPEALLADDAARLSLLSEMHEVQARMLAQAESDDHNMELRLGDTEDDLTLRVRVNADQPSTNKRGSLNSMNEFVDALMAAITAASGGGPEPAGKPSAVLEDAKLFLEKCLQGE